jgi:hypothetical protein
MLTATSTTETIKPTKLSQHDIWALVHISHSVSISLSIEGHLTFNRVSIHKGNIKAYLSVDIPYEGEHWENVKDNLCVTDLFELLNPASALNGDKLVHKEF